MGKSQLSLSFKNLGWEEEKNTTKNLLIETENVSSLAEKNINIFKQ